MTYSSLDKWSRLASVHAKQAEKTPCDDGKNGAHANLPERRLQARLVSDVLGT